MSTVLPPFWRRLGLRTQLALFTSLLVGALAWGQSLFAGQRAAHELEQRIGTALVDTAQNLAELLDRAMWSRSGEVRVLASLTAFRELRVGGEVEHILETLQEALPIFTWVGLTDREGTVIAATDRILVGRSIATRPVFQEGVRGFFIGDVHDAVLLASKLPNPSGEPIQFVDIATAVRDADGQTVGVLAAHLSWAWAREVERSLIGPAGQRRQADMLVVSREGTVLLAPEGIAPGSQLALAGLARARRSGPHWQIETWPDGRRYLTGYALADGHQDYPGLGWTIVARQPVEQAFAAATALTDSLRAAGLVLAALFALLAWRMADYLLRPLHTLAEAAILLRRGHIDQLPRLQGSQEIRRLSLALRGLVRTLTHRERALVTMSGLANTDALTGLPNRLALDAFVARIGASPAPPPLAWLAIDLDGFKPVNDTHGHAAGDALLQEVAQRLRQCVRQDDLLARQGGDEFCAVVHVEGDRPAEQALQVAQRILHALRQPIAYRHATLQVGASIGIALWPHDAASPTEAARQADAALYVAKARGRGCAVHAPPAADAPPAG